MPLLTLQKERLGREEEGKGIQETCSAKWLSVLDFMVTGLVSGLSLVNHSNSGSFLVAHCCSVKMNASKEDSGRWSDTWCLLSTFPGWWWLLSSVFLTRTSCCKITHVNGYDTWPRWAVLVSMFPLTFLPTPLLPAFCLGSWGRRA